MNRTLRTYNKLKGFPLGRKIFSMIVCWQAPYFGTIKPLFEELEPGRCVITIKNRKAVHNHIGSVHAIAMCNICELAGGICTDISLPSHLRWIPKGMTVEYVAIARTDLRGICEFDLKTLESWDLKNDFPVRVNVYDEAEQLVMWGEVIIYLSEKGKSKDE